MEVLDDSASAAIAQLGERQTEDLKVPGSIPGLGIIQGAAECRTERTTECRGQKGPGAGREPKGEGAGRE